MEMAADPPHLVKMGGRGGGESGMGEVRGGFKLSDRNWAWRPYIGFKLGYNYIDKLVIPICIKKNQGCRVLNHRPIV